MASAAQILTEVVLIAKQAAQEWPPFAQGGQWAFKQLASDAQAATTKINRSLKSVGDEAERASADRGARPGGLAGAPGGL